MKLSEVNTGDIFNFEATEKPRYLTGKWNDYATLDCTEGLMFIVLKKNKNSVKCRLVTGSIEYTFKFAGYFNNYVETTDYVVNKIADDNKCKERASV